MVNLYTCDEIADRYGVTVGTVWGWVRQKKLNAIRISSGKGLRISEDDVAEFENARRTIPLENQV